MLENLWVICAGHSSGCISKRCSRNTFIRGVSLTCFAVVVAVLDPLLRLLDLPREPLETLKLDDIYLGAERVSAALLVLLWLSVLDS